MRRWTMAGRTYPECRCTVRLNDALLIALVGRLHDETRQRKRDVVDGLYELSQRVENTLL